MKSVIDKSGVKKISFHAMRHTHASLLRLLNVDYKKIATRLGHANEIITIEYYLHLMPGEKDDTSEKVQNLFKYGQ